MVYKSIIRIILTVAVASLLSSFVPYFISQINSNILSTQIKNTSGDIIISKQGYFENKNNNFENNYIENTSNVISYFSNNNVSNLSFTSSIKYSGVVNIGKKEAIKNIYAIDFNLLESIVPKSEHYKLKDFNKYDIVLDKDFANILGLNEGDEIIINFSGQEFMHYADLFYVKAITSIQNISMKNALIISKDYLKDVINTDDIASEIYVNINKKTNEDEIDNIADLASIFSNNALGLDIHSKYDIISGYGSYLSILNFSMLMPIIIFFFTFLLFSSIFIRSKYNCINYLIDKIKSKNIIFIAAGAEVIISAAIFILITTLLSMRFTAIQNYTNIYTLLINIASILIISTAMYVLCLFRAKKEMSW